MISPCGSVGYATSISFTGRELLVIINWVYQLFLWMKIFWIQTTEISPQSPIKMLHGEFFRDVTFHTYNKRLHTSTVNTNRILEKWKLVEQRDNLEDNIHQHWQRQLRTETLPKLATTLGQGQFIACYLPSNTRLLYGRDTPSPLEVKKQTAVKSQTQVTG